jgi:tRNA(Ser,Leu) C12 N-acetylase TAN1
MADANLLVTFDPTHIESAKKEISERMKDLKEKGKILKIEEGLAEMKVSDSRKVIKALTKLSKKESNFQYTKKWIPIDKWCSAKVPDMQKCIKSAIKDLKAKDKWKMDLGKHRADVHDMETIIKLTSVIENKNVDLEKPDKIIKVEIVEKKAGIALLNKDDLLNVSK